MSLHRYDAARDCNEAEIVAALRGVGATVVLISAVGVPDLLVGYRGRNFLLEVKQPLGPRGGGSHASLTDAQVEFIQQWRGEVCVVRSPEQALAAISSQ
jgi:hypothetical protein